MAFEDFQRRVGERVKKARWITGMTQEDAAAKAGLTYRYYQELERGRVNPTLRTLFSLARAFGRSVSELVEVEGKKTRGAALADAEATPPKVGRRPKVRRRTSK